MLYLSDNDDNRGDGFAEILIVQSHPAKVPYPLPHQQWGKFGVNTVRVFGGYWRTSADRMEGGRMAAGLARKGFSLEI